MERRKVKLGAPKSELRNLSCGLKSIETSNRDRGFFECLLNASGTLGVGGAEFGDGSRGRQAVSCSLSK